MADPTQALSDSQLEQARVRPGQGPGHCGSCGRFVGPYDRCPYCGAATHGRLALRLVKIAALLLATLGLIGLWYLARAAEVPTVHAGDATGTMNLAYVRLSGRIARSLTYEAESGYLGFWLADDTGEVYISAYRDVTAELLARDRVPAIGDRVTVAGTLRIREDMTSLTVNVPDHLSLERPAPLQLKAGNITMLDEGLRVQVAGTVQEIAQPYEGLTLIHLADESGEITVAIDEVVTALTGKLPEIVPGQPVSVTGAVTLYRATPQIAPASVADVVVLGAPPEAGPEPLTSLGELSSGDQRTTVRVGGRILLLEGLPGGVKATLDDGTAQVDLVLWDSIHQGLQDPSGFDVGAEVEVTGEVKVYQGALEVVPSHPEDVVLLVAAQPAPWVDIGELEVADAGRTVRVRGMLAEPYGFSSGVKAQLKDGTGKITVLFWSNLYTQLAPEPAAGQEVEVTGLVDAYGGKLELVPRSRYDWFVRLRDD